MPRKKTKKHTQKKEIKVTPTQKRKARRVAVSSVLTAVLLTFFTLLQIATVQISNSDFPTGNIIPTQDADTQSWKTYADNRFGFSFQYPDNLFSVVDDSENDHAVIPTGYPEVIVDVPNDFFVAKGYEAPHQLFSIRVQSGDTTANAQSPFSLWIFENRGMFSPDNWYEKYDYYPFAFAPHIPAPVNPDQPIQNVLIGDTLGKYHLRVSDSGGERAYVYVQRENTMFLLVVNDTTGDGNVGEKMLSTIRFFKTSGGK